MQLRERFIINLSGAFLALREITQQVRTRIFSPLYDFSLFGEVIRQSCAISISVFSSAMSRKNAPRGVVLSLSVQETALCCKDYG